MNKTLEKVAVTWARALLRGTDYHIKYRPGRHPETRKKLNGAVSKVLEKYEVQGFEDYEEVKENGEVGDDWEAGRGTRKGSRANHRGAKGLRESLF